jgi:hypothetical protein
MTTAQKPPSAAADDATEPHGRERGCSSCGTIVGTADRFCPSCGAPQTHGTHRDHPTRAVQPESPPARTKRTWLLLIATVVALLGAAAGVVALSGALTDDGKSAVEKRQSAQRAKSRATRARVLPAFGTAMQSREQLFAAERHFVTGMAGARSKLRDYRKQSAAVAAQTQTIDAATAAQFDACIADLEVACPAPNYPNPPPAPDLTGEIKQLRAASTGLESLHADVLSVTPEPELKVLYAQLVQAATTLNADATYNADTLTQAVTPAGSAEGTGLVEYAKVKTLHKENALPAIRHMNDAAVRVIGMLKLRRSAYDVPGGRDVDPSDHSTKGQ